MRWFVRTLALALTAIALAGTVSCTSDPEDSAMPRDERASQYATGVVAVIVQNEKSDASSFFGMDLSDEEMARLRTGLSDSLPLDPKSYGAVFETDPAAADAVTATVSPTDASEDVDSTFLVALKWSSSKPYEVWVDGEMIGVVAGDWVVEDVVHFAGD